MPRKKTPAKTRAKNSAKVLTHLDAQGRVHMVDVGAKAVTRREAIARGAVKMAPATLDAIVGGRLKKGEALAAARLAGIMAAKKTAELIPLCHQIPLQVVEVEFTPDLDHATLNIEARAVTEAQTGVEMEAMAAVSVAALTIYDMAKAIDRAMVIDAIRLVAKSGGRSGDFVRPGETPARAKA
jgi:cyclic pyranopterin phosphate synthase